MLPSWSGSFLSTPIQDVKSGFRSRFVDESFASEASATFLIVDEVILIVDDVISICVRMWSWRFRQISADYFEIEGDRLRSCQKITPSG